MNKFYTTITAAILAAGLLGITATTIAPADAKVTCKENWCAGDGQRSENGEEGLQISGQVDGEAGNLSCSPDDGCSASENFEDNIGSVDEEPGDSEDNSGSDADTAEVEE